MTKTQLKLTEATLKERGIILRQHEVQAILNGRQTQLRRSVTVHWHKGHRCAPYDPAYVESEGELYFMDEYGDYHKVSERLGFYGYPGNLLWVKETHAWLDAQMDSGPREDPVCVGFRADDTCYRFEPDPRLIEFNHPSDMGGFKWRPSTNMPRWASRTTLKIADIHVQRVQDISESDAIAEGLISQVGDGEGFHWKGTGYHGGSIWKGHGKTFHTPRREGEVGCACIEAGPSPAQCAFRELWDRLNKKRGFGWDSNPWVWAITFDPFDKP